MVASVRRPGAGPQDAVLHKQQDPSSRSLSPNLRQLFQQLWRTGFGTFRGVHFRDGDPLFDPPFHVVRKARTTEQAWPHRGSLAAEFTLKREHIRFIEELVAAGNGVVDIKVVKGLPVDLDIHEQA